MLQPEAAGAIAKMVVPLSEQRGKLPTGSPRADIRGSAISFTCDSTLSWRIASNSGASGGIPASAPSLRRDRSENRRHGTHPPRSANTGAPVPLPRVAEIERIPAPGPVVIIAIFPYPIIATVVDSAQGDGGTFKIDFRAMVEHDIQNHLDTGGVQRLNRIAKLIRARVGSLA